MEHGLCEDFARGPEKYAIDLQAARRFPPSRPVGWVDDFSSQLLSGGVAVCVLGAFIPAREPYRLRLLLLVGDPHVPIWPETGQLNQVTVLDAAWGRNFRSARL